MPNFRGILTFALPAVTVVFGFIWFFGRKKTPKPKLLPKEDDQSESTGKSSVPTPSLAELSKKTKEKESVDNFLPDVKSRETVEKENHRNGVLASPVGSRKRKAFQITRSDDVEVSDGADSVEEEMNKENEIVPVMSHSVPNDTQTSSQDDTSGNCQCETKKMGSSQNGAGEVTESELIPVNESMVSESSSQSLLSAQSILCGEKTSLMNDAFMTSGISEQSILGEKDKQCKVDDISLCTSLSEPLLESTLLDTTQSQPQLEVVEDVTDKKESSLTDKVPSVNIKESSSSKNSPSPPSSVSEKVTKQTKDTVNTVNGETLEKNSINEKKKEKNSHTAEKTETDKHKTAIDSRKTSSPKHTDRKATSPAKKENHQNELSRKSKQEVKSSPPKDRSISRKTHPSGGSDQALDNGVHGSDSNSSGCDNASEASNDSGRGPSMTDLPTPITSPNHQIYHCNFPTAICGRLIGKQGKNINFIKEKSGANITLSANPFTPEFQLCSIEGTQREIDAALRQIGRKFPEVDLGPVNIPSGDAPQSAVLMPDIMQVMPGISQLSLPEGVSVDVVVSSIVDAGHIFIQQPTHPSFPSLERLNQFMIACYMQDGLVPQLPRPLEVGVICAAPMLNGWYRAQISAVSEDSDECDIKYVDYGGFSRVQGSTLRQIRSDFMTLPFQACECYMANITPLQDEEFFSAEAAAILEELTQGKMLQAQVVGRSEEGIPYVHIYQINGEKVTFVNRELVNRGVTRWIEVLS